MKKEGSIEKNLRILLKYGQKLLKNNEEISQRFIKEIILSIISINNNSGTNSMTNYKYEKLITIYINMERLLEDLLDYIMIKDEENCSNLIIHR